MIQIESFARKKKTGTSSSSTSSLTTGGGFASSKVTVEEVQGVNIWGQYHDHTGDIDGDLISSGNITGAGITSTGTITAETGQINGNLDVDGSITTTNATLTGDLTANDGTFTGDISCDELTGNSIETTNLNSEEIVTERLTVTKQAHFFNLTIDEIKSVGGQVILSAGNATIDHVLDVGSSYMVAWKKTDDENGVSNQFKAGDQVICQTFNKTDATGQNVTNKYYWALVSSIGTGTYTIDGEDVECHYIELSKSYYDGSSVPEVGDKICQLGYRGNDDPARQSAIILSAYQSPDPNVTAPSIVQYAGINSFSLQGCIVNQMSPSQNLFTGNFKVVNGSTTTDVIDLIQGQYPQVIVDSEQAWMMADSTGKTYVGTDYQNVPTTIQAFLGSQIIPYSEWITGSQIKYKNQTYRLTGNSPSPATGTGLLISSITRNTNDVTIGWAYTPNTSYDTQTQTTTNNGTSVSNTDMEITLVFTHSGTTYTVTKKVPFNVIKASAVTQGADAEFDKLMIDKLDLTVTLDNKLTCKVDAKVFHVKGSQISQVTDLTNYSADLLLSNNQTVTLSKSTYFYRTSNISNSYSSMTNPPTSAVLRLYRSGTLVDEVPVAIKFDSGSIFTITDNAITSAVSQANSYTDTNISTVTQTANSISSRVTNIENDYVTSSELTQTANNIQLNVYDELRNKTGIDIANGKITLNGNTEISGNLTLSNSTQGFTLQGSEGITQIAPQSVGTYNDFKSRTTTSIQLSYRGAEPGIEGTNNNWIFTINANYVIGVIKSGNIITIKPDFYRSFTNTYSGAALSNYTVTRITYVIFEDSSQRASGTVTSSDVSYTSGGGNIILGVTYTLDVPGSNFPDIGGAYAIPSVSSYTCSHITVPNEAYMLIGYDGLAVNFGTSATAYIGTESTTINYGNYGLQISPSGLKRWVGDEWLGINRLKVKSFSTNYTLGEYDDFLIFQGTTSGVDLALGTGERGRIIYVRNRGTEDLHITGRIMVPQGTETYQGMTLQNRYSSGSLTTYHSMVQFISDGGTWYLGYCG